jgi:hypothetical protein
MNKTFPCCLSLFVALCLIRTQVCYGFVIPLWRCDARGQIRRLERSENDRTSTYETADASSKSIVSSLTSLVNFIMTPKTAYDECNGTERYRSSRPVYCPAFSFCLGENAGAESLPSPPACAVELMNRIRDDYTVNNYLWTGNIDLTAFEKDCRFTDPTLSFVGTDTFVSNVQNLRPIVDSLIIPPAECRSDLLHITVNEKEMYVETRWNMVGELCALPWKPRIDVIGRTKFWYRKRNGSGYRIYFYDECWEIPAAQALLQLVTPAGTIPNSRGQ